jgi:hypothetical protein
MFDVKDWTHLNRPIKDQRPKFQRVKCAIFKEIYCVPTIMGLPQLNRKQKHHPLPHISLIPVKME